MHAALPYLCSSNYPTLATPLVYTCLEQLKTRMASHEKSITDYFFNCFSSLALVHISLNSYQLYKLYY